MNRNKVSQQPPGEPITEDQMARWTPRGRPAWMADDPEDQMSSPSTWHRVRLQSVEAPRERWDGRSQIN